MFKTESEQEYTKTQKLVRQLMLIREALSVAAMCRHRGLVKLADKIEKDIEDILIEVIV